MSKSLLKSTSVVSAFTLLSRVLGLARDIMLTHQFGGARLDAFLFAQLLPNLGRRMFAEGAFSQAFVPVFAETRIERPHEEVRDLIAVVMGTLGGVLSVITVVGCLAAPLWVWILAPGFDSDPVQAALGAQLLRWTFPYLMFISLTSMAGSVLNAYGQFAVPAFTPVILNLCIIASAFISPDSVQILAYAVFIAGILQFFVQLPSLARLHLAVWPRWAWSDVRVKRIVALMAPVMIGSSVAQISLLLNTSLATMAGPGSVSWLSFGSRLMEFPTGIFSAAVGTVILPSLSNQHVERSPEGFAATLDWGMRTMLLLGVPSAVGLVQLAGPLVATIYGHGKFSPHDVAMTTWVVWAYGVGFLGFSAVRILVPAFYSRQDTKRPVRYAIIGFASGIVASLILFQVARWQQWPAPHVVFAISTSLTSWINSILLFRHLRQSGVYRAQPGWGGFVLRLATATVAMALIVDQLSGPLEAWIALGTLGRVARLSVVIGAAVAGYFGVLMLCGWRPRDLRAAPRT
jgi:putative peptidoglycan lipid II flippase